MATGLVKRVLMVAFHFPPLHGSSGIQRTLKFVQYLPAAGWQPLVLSAHQRAYAATNPEQLAQIPSGVPVRRAFALDTARHLSLRGRYPRWLALPDRWAAWCLGAVPGGLALIRRHRPFVLWSTYPIASALLATLLLHKLSGLPWVIDLRDPMMDEYIPADPPTRRVIAWLEQLCLRHCSAIVCTTPGTIRTYRARYPTLPAQRFHLIENAYDEENFCAAAQAAVPAAAPRPAGPLRLLHSGTVYPIEREPDSLFAALAALQATGQVCGARLQIVLRASGHEAHLAQLIARHGIAELVQLAPPLPYEAALAEMLAADGLLVLQASMCNAQVPAKLYEYLRAGRPILALTDAGGDTAAVLRAAGISTMAPLDQPAAIMAALLDFMQRCAAGQAPRPDPAIVAGHSRQARSRQLAALLDGLLPPHFHRDA